MKTSLYRHFDAAGTLLYVGISSHVTKRLLSHKSVARWYYSIATVKVEHFDTYEEAARAETRAIFTESPVHNILGKPKQIKILVEKVLKPENGMSKDEAAARHYLSTSSTQTYAAKLYGASVQSLNRYLKILAAKYVLRNGATEEKAAKKFGISQPAVAAGVKIIRAKQSKDPK